MKQKISGEVAEGSKNTFPDGTVRVKVHVKKNIRLKIFDKRRSRNRKKLQILFFFQISGGLQPLAYSSSYASANRHR